ncbi:MAG: formylglycine-generating enzyme family protein [Bacteroidia bacterium]|nr:formylglycine-generating enzyme family protein [Bacteroidia bacterium]
MQRHIWDIACFLLGIFFFISSCKESSSLINIKSDVDVQLILNKDQKLELAGNEAHKISIESYPIVIEAISVENPSNKIDTLISSQPLETIFLNFGRIEEGISIGIQSQSWGKRKGKKWTPGNTPEPQMKEVPSGQFKAQSEEISQFLMGKTEVTYAQYCAFLNVNGNQNDKQEGIRWIDLDGIENKIDLGRIPRFESKSFLIDEWEYCRIFESQGYFFVEEGYENHPVAFVSFYGAKAYCEWLGGKLPNEKEWEYAAAEASFSAPFIFSGSNDFKKVANVATGAELNYPGPKEVGSLSPNALGLFDMSGNLWEWCARSELNSLKDNLVICKGGSWFNPPTYSEISKGTSVSPSIRSSRIGFRVIKSKP